MAGHPIHRKQFKTDESLLKLAIEVPLFPKRDRGVFYAEELGARLAASFVKNNSAYMRLDELLAQTALGRELWCLLTSGHTAWNGKEEVWWELSWRLARAAEGVVNVFGPTRFVRNEPISAFRHKYTTGAYANTVFEKVELPELENNPRVTRILFNGEPFE